MRRMMIFRIGAQLTQDATASMRPMTQGVIGGARAHWYSKRGTHDRI